MSHNIGDHDESSDALMPVAQLTARNDVVTLGCDKSSRRLITDLLPIVQKHKPTPEQLRYAFKQIRIITGIKRPARPAKLPKFYTPGEVYAIMEGAAKAGPEHRLLIDILFQTGLRISELQKLDLRDLLPEDHKLLVRAGKGQKDRIVPLSSTLNQQIRLYVRERRAGPIFEGKSVRTLQRWYDDALRLANVDKRGGPHTARHTFATILRARGFTLDDIQLLMGHSSRVTTEIYAKLSFTPEIKAHYLQLFEGGGYLQQ